MNRTNAGAAAVAGLAAISLCTLAWRFDSWILALLEIALIGASGYVWANALLSAAVPGIERVAVAAGVALAVPVLGGVTLNAAGVPLRRAAWVVLFAAVALAGSAMLAVRGRGGRRTDPRIRPCAPLARLAWLRLLAFAAAIVIAGGGVALARAAAVAEHRPGFTELWLITPGARGDTATLGIISHEGHGARYRLVLVRDRTTRNTWNLRLGSGQSWRVRVSLSRDYAITADLYKWPDLAHPYREVTATGRAGG
jgi:hypothetical protein